MDVPHTGFLARIRRLFAAPGPHLDVIVDALAAGKLPHPAQPMSDQELTRAIREFQTVPPPDAALKRLGTHFAEPKRER